MHEELYFPPVEMASEEGLLAVGGDLSAERLLLAYRSGIFPWYSEGQPILWWSPDPRLILIPGEMHVSKSLRKTVRKGVFTVTMDKDFRGVIENCAEARGEGRDGTWITPEMAAAYCRLHELGHAHSVECWSAGRLAGGLYGIALGRCFFGESMFSLQPDASKVALLCLAEQLKRWDFSLIDCQQSTEHLLSLGAREVSRAAFLGMIEEGVQRAGPEGKWDFKDEGQTTKD